MLSALNGLSSFKLKKTKSTLKFTEISFSLQKEEEMFKKCSIIRMREIDCSRRYLPLLEERELFKIPQSFDRLILSDHINVMILCGGYAGVHFSPQVLFLSFYSFFYSLLLVLILILFSCHFFLILYSFSCFFFF